MPFLLLLHRLLLCFFEDFEDFLLLFFLHFLPPQTPTTSLRPVMPALANFMMLPLFCIVFGVSFL